MKAVIGAGPAGSYYASQEKSQDVHLFEDHKKIGTPVACTGIVTDAIEGFLKVPRRLVVSKIKQFKIIAPNGKATYVDLKKTNKVMDRARFDQYVFEKAVDNGAHVHLGESFRGYRTIGKGLYRMKTSKRSYDVPMIVGADGPKSSVARSAGLYGKRQFVQGWQARCKFPELENGVTEIHLGLGEFSWVVPEDDKIARVGVIGYNNAALKRDYKKLLGASKIIEDQSGIIPLYNPKQKIRKGSEDIFLLGDAATHVKATTYGGIIYGMIAGKYLAEDKETFVKNVDKKLSKDLWISLKMREYMNHMSEKQANDLITIFQKKTNNDILAEHDRNFPSKFVVQLLMKEAKLWKLGFDIFKNKLKSR
ncbi:MAG: hypothetical protein ACMXYE_02295 [Candidatus Woesearchaeota archaeon]